MGQKAWISAEIFSLIAPATEAWLALRAQSMPTATKTAFLRSVAKKFCPWKRCWKNTDLAFYPPI